MDPDKLGVGESRHRFDTPEGLPLTSPAPHSRQIVYIIDDDEGCRSSLQRLVQSFGYDVFSFASAEEFLNYDRSDSAPVAECAIVDYRLSGMSGLDLQDTLRQCAPHMMLMLMSGVAPFATAAEAVRKGALALLEKPIRGVLLQSALHDAFAGSLVSTAHREEASMEKVRLVRRLSPREREVAQLVAQGLSNKEMAQKLTLSEKTIEKYRSNCVKKLLAKSSTEMVRTVVMAEMLGVD